MKMVINGGSTMNIVAQSADDCCHMKVQFQPYPFKVAWVNRTNLTFTQIRKVHIQIGGYNDEILRDVLVMDVA